MMNEKKASFGFFVAVALVAVLIAPVLYVFSTGPVVFLFSIEAINDGTLQMFFAPLSITEEWIPEWLWTDLTATSVGGLIWPSTVE